MKTDTKPTKLFNKNFLLLWQGQLVSQLGNNVVMVGQTLWIMHATGLATLMAIPAVIWSLVTALFGLLSGSIVDTYSRKKIIVFCDLFGGIGQLFLVILMFVYADKTWLIYGVILLLCILQGILSSLFMPAIQAAIPDIVPKDKLEKANSIKNSSQQVAMLFGQGTGGYLFRMLGAPVLFLIDGITYLLSALSESFITIPQEKISRNITNWKDRVSDHLKQIKAGLSYIGLNKGLKKLIILFVLIHFFTAPFIILLPFFVEDYLQTGLEWYGFLMAGMGGGALIGSVIAGIIKVPKQYKSIFAIVSLIIQCILGAIFGFISSPFTALIVFILIGTSGAFFNIIFQTAVQINTPSELRGRVFGVIGTISIGLAPLGMGLASILADLTGRKVPLIFLCACIIPFIFSIASLFTNNVREFLNYE